ncbi:MAG: DUF3833 domain-containing protein [Burkholderiales bacterium]|nr:DUF3833 domain-containing protein [Burkholderiales bacterium]MCC7112935.1 DUF3833 domain-containing protein [Burkholderiales bacterium]
MKRPNPRSPSLIAGFRAALAAIGVLGLASCASVDVSQYRSERPALDLARYFDGTLDGWGMFQDRSGAVVTRFNVVVEATWRDATGTLDESFEYADGRRERRVWTIVKDGDRYRGTAADVVGAATGVAVGNALRWNYVLALPVDGRVWHMDMDDWMFLVDERTMLNRTTMSKFGARVGEVTLAFRKR